MGLLIFLALWTTQAVDLHAEQSAQPSAPVQSHVGNEHPWELEIYAGGISGAGGIDGSGQPLPPSRPFVESILGVTTTTPTFPSWYFGSGASYLNEGLGARGLRIAPLDSVLTTASGTRQGGRTLGGRVSRRITRRVRIEVAAEHSRETFGPTRDTRDQLEKTRASFATLFSGLISPVASFSATSTAAVRESGTVIAVTGAAAIDLLSWRGLTPFALAGAGVASRMGDTHSISLNGQYVVETGFSLNRVPVRITQSDNIAIRYSLPTHRPLAIVGGGFRYAISRRFVARLDARTYLARDRVEVLLDANPSTTSNLTSGIATSTLFSFPPPFSLSFSTDPAGRNSLRGPALSDIVTFSGSGMHARFTMTAGLGWRF